MRNRALITASVTFCLALCATAAQAQVGSFCLRPLGIPDKWIENQTPPWDPTDTFDPTGTNPDAYPPAYGYDSTVDQGRPMSLVLYSRTGAPQGQSAWPIVVGEEGGDAFANAIAACPSYPHSVGESFPSVTGNVAGPFGSGFGNLIARDPNAAWDPAANGGRGGVVNSDFAQSPRVIALPVFAPDTYGKSTSVSPAMVKIVGFFVSEATARGVNGYLTGWSQLAVPAVTARIGEHAQLSATFAGPGSPIFGQPVEFLFEDRLLATAYTDGTGTARPSTTSFRVESMPGFYPGAIRARLADPSSFFIADEALGDLSVLRKLPVITWAPPADITYGTPLGPQQLNATADTEGEFSYFPAAGTVLPAKQSITLTATFVPADSDFYDQATASTYQMVLPAEVIVKVNDAGKFYLDPLPPFSFTATGLVNGDTASSVFGGMTFQTNATASSDVGTYPVNMVGAVGAENYSFGFLSGTLTIAPRPTTSLVTSASPSPSTYGQPVTFTLTVSSGVGVPTGTVSLLRGDVVVGTGTLANGQARVTVSTLNAGSNPLSAQYAGAGGFAASSSAFIAHVVNRASTATQLISSVNPARAGQVVTLTAAVSSVAPGGGVPTGSVEFLRGGVVIATLPLSSGRAVLNISTLAAGKHAIQARFVGTTDYAASASAVLQQTVKGGGK